MRQIADGEYAWSGLTPEAGERVIDIGANVGVFALWAARRGARVWSYEPGPAAFACLAGNTRRRQAITATNAAVVGAVAPGGMVTLFLHDERSTRNSLLDHEIGSGAEMTNRIAVAAIAIDEVLRDGCDLLKVDCEGAEFELFRCVSADTMAGVKRIVLEFHRTAGDPAALIARLRGLGFEAKVLAGAADSDSFGVIGAVRV